MSGVGRIIYVDGIRRQYEDFVDETHFAYELDGMPYPAVVEVVDMMGRKCIVTIFEDLTHKIELCSDIAQRDLQEMHDALPAVTDGDFLHFSFVGRHLVTQTVVGLKPSGKKRYRYSVGGGWTCSVLIGGNVEILFKGKPHSYVNKFLKYLVSEGIISHQDHKAFALDVQARAGRSMAANAERKVHQLRPWRNEYFRGQIKLQRKVKRNV